MSIDNKLTKLAQTKSAIKSALISQGQSVTDEPFSSYANKILAIEGGGGGDIAAITGAMTSMNNMFYNSQATVLDVSGFDTSSVTTMYGMFYNSQATVLDVSGFDTSNVTNMSCMFRNSKATVLDLSSFDFSKVTSTVQMFRDASVQTIYVKNQSDADFVTATTYFPAGVSVIIK